MCSTVQLPDGTVVQTVQGLADQGWALTDVETDGLDLGSCLCCIDAGAVLDRAGVGYRYDPAWGDYIVGASDG